MTGLPDRLPAALSQRLSSATQAIYVRQGREVDVSIGGIPFRLATSNDLPSSVETVQIQRNQMDVESDPGEQSLSTWWRRSQASWHEGAGDLYQENYGYDNGLKHVNSFSFYDSAGIDVFTQGQLTLLKKMELWSGAPTGLANLRTAVDTAGTRYVTGIAAGSLQRATPGGAWSVVHDAALDLYDGMVVGDSFYSLDVGGNIFEGTVASPGTATSWPLANTVSDNARFILWGKQRLWAVGYRCLWQPDVTAAGGTSQDPIFTHPNQGWRYTCAAETPSSMLFAGHDGFNSTIQLITLDSGGGLPTLSGASVATVMPNGELIQQLAVLAGQYVGIGTTAGFRVGVVDQSGGITYGPLLIQAPDSDNSCTAITTQGRFFVVAFDFGVFRVDTGTPLNNGIFPYASDINCGTTVTSMTISGNQIVASASGTGQTWLQSATKYVDSGWITMGRIRFRTTEPKNFKALSLEIAPLEGAISCTLVQEGGTELPLRTISDQGNVFDDFINISVGPMKYVAPKFTLAPGSGGTTTPTIHSYMVRALPAVPPERLITLPLLCYDKEKSSSGQYYGGQDFAADRLQALQILEDAADTIIFQDFTGLDSSGRIVTIDALKFVQTSPPSIRTAGSVEGAGGVLIAQLRTVT